MDVASGDFFVLSVVQNDFAVFDQNAGFGDDLVIWGEESLKVGLVNGELVFGAVLENQWVGRSNVQVDTWFLGQGLSVGLVLNNVVDDGWYA